MKKIILILISVIIAFVGVPNIMPTRVEMNHIEIVRIMGIDRADDGNVQVTWVRNYANNEGGGGIGAMEEAGNGEEGGEAGVAESAAVADPPSNTISRTSPTVAGAIAELRRAMEREVPSGHIEFILIGESAVQHDILKYIDYLSRDTDARLSAKVYFVREGSANELLNSIPPDFILTEKLSNLSRNSGASVISSEKTLADFLRKISSDLGDGIVPNVQLVEVNGQKIVRFSGYTIIENRRFAGYMGTSAARGYNLIRQNSPGGYMNIRYHDNYASLRINNFNTRINFIFDGNHLERVQITTNIDAKLSEAQTIQNASITELESLTTSHIREQIGNAVYLSQQYRSDFLNLSEQIRLRHPYRWAQIRENWRETLAITPIEVVVTTNIVPTHSPMS